MLEGEAIKEEINRRLLAPVIAEEKESDHEADRVGRKIIQGELVFAREDGEERVDREVETALKLLDEPSHITRRRIVRVVPRTTWDQRTTHG